MPKSLKLTRERHLDHMVRMAPLICMGFLIQSYLITQMDSTPSGKNMIIILAVALCLLITGLLCYDIGHQVELFEDHLQIKVKYLKMDRRIDFTDILSAEHADKESHFGSVTLTLFSGEKLIFYFIDSDCRIKEWLEQNTQKNYSQAA